MPSNKKKNSPGPGCCSCNAVLVGASAHNAPSPLANPHITRSSVIALHLGALAALWRSEVWRMVHGCATLAALAEKGSRQDSPALHRGAQAGNQLWTPVQRRTLHSSECALTSVEKIDLACA